LTESLLSNPLLLAVPLVVAAFAGYVAYRNNFKSRHAAACAAFRSAVTGKLSSLYPLPVAWPSNPESQLRGVFPELQAAVSQFRPYVPRHQRGAFDHAWLQYRSAYLREIDVQCYHHYIAFEGQPDPQGTFKVNVGRLLSYAGQS
jgi:hypothetical protein